MEYDDIISALSENPNIIEDLIYWLSENGYLDDYKIGLNGFDDEY